MATQPEHGPVAEGGHEAKQQHHKGLESVGPVSIGSTKQGHPRPPPGSKPFQKTPERLETPIEKGERNICVKTCFEICSYSPQVRERNQTAILAACALMLSGLYAAMGFIALKECNIQEALPYYAFISGIVLCILTPSLVCGCHKQFLAYLRSSVNEDLHSSVIKGLLSEMQGFKGKLRVIFVVLLVVVVISWWILGCYLCYSVAFDVDFGVNESQESGYKAAEIDDDPIQLNTTTSTTTPPSTSTTTASITTTTQANQKPNYCEPVVYYITFEIVTMIWIIVGLSSLWLVALICCDERFRMSITDLLRYEIIYKDKLSYDLEREKERMSRIVRLSKKIKKDDPSIV